MQPVPRTAIGIALLNRAAIQAALADRSSWTGVALLVALTGIAGASPSIVNGRFSDAFATLIAALSGWLVLGTLVTSLGNWAFAPEERHADWRLTTRAIGLAQAPGLLRAIGVVDSAGLAVAILAFAWQSLAVTTVIREAFSFHGRLTPAVLWAVAFVPYLAIQVGLQLLLTQ
ncbi:MAG: hypothetical protein HYY34_08105 [Chloroflexi bacterium]|nr:hypothetical protein [Chloroflexota bacterium]